MGLAEVKVRHDWIIIGRLRENLNGTGVPRCACQLPPAKPGRDPDQPPSPDSQKEKSRQNDQKPAVAALRLVNELRYLLTTRLFVTENTFGTPLARNPARFLSLSLSATPSSVTFPFFTMMWIEGTADSA